MLEAGEMLPALLSETFCRTLAADSVATDIKCLWHWGKVLLEQWWLAPYGSAKLCAFDVSHWRQGVGDSGDRFKLEAKLCQRP